MARNKAVEASVKALVAGLLVRGVVGGASREHSRPRTHWLNLASCSSFPNTYGGPRSVSVKHVWKNVARRRTKNSTKNFFWVRAGLFVGCRESLQSVWGEILKEKEISPCLTVRADW